MADEIAAGGRDQMTAGLVSLLPLDQTGGTGRCSKLPPSLPDIPGSSLGALNRSFRPPAEEGDGGKEVYADGDDGDVVRAAVVGTPGQRRDWDKLQEVTYESGTVDAGKMAPISRKYRSDRIHQVGSNRPIRIVRVESGQKEIISVGIKSIL